MSNLGKEAAGEIEKQEEVINNRELNAVKTVTKLRGSIISELHSSEFGIWLLPAEPGPAMVTVGPRREPKPMILFARGRTCFQSMSRVGCTANGVVGPVSQRVIDEIVVPQRQIHQERCGAGELTAHGSIPHRGVAQAGRLQVLSG